MNSPIDEEKPTEVTIPGEVGGSFVPRWGILLSLAFALALSAFLVYSLIAVWPESGAAAAGALSSNARIAFFGTHFRLSADARFFVIVATAGALGGVLHSLRSLSWYVGNRRLRWSWVPFYVLLPIVGVAASTIFYLVLRAGLFSSGAAPAAGNAYGFAAIGGLVGLFSEEALKKLQDVFSSLFSPAPQGRDRTP